MTTTEETFSEMNRVDQEDPDHKPYRPTTYAGQERYQSRPHEMEMVEIRVQLDQEMEEIQETGIKTRMHRLHQHRQLHSLAQEITLLALLDLDLKVVPHTEGFRLRTFRKR